MTASPSPAVAVVDLAPGAHDGDPTAVLHRLASDPVVRVVVLRGLADPDPAADLGAAVPAVAHQPQPVVAVLEGVVRGAALGLALAADLRLGAAGARLDLGDRPPVAGTSWTLPRLVGHATALELLLRRPVVDAERAASLGLLTAVPPAELEAALAACCDDLLRLPVHVATATRRAVAWSATQDLVSSLDHEARLAAVADQAR
ncbi:MAG: enoyl-CoA hydratase-related protein [Aeromicrobium erythreum]